jgi:hypothetical protein
MGRGKPRCSAWSHNAFAGGMKDPVIESCCIHDEQRAMSHEPELHERREDDYVSKERNADAGGWSACLEDEP